MKAISIGLPQSWILSQGVTVVKELHNSTALLVHVGYSVDLQDVLLHYPTKSTQVDLTS